MLRSTRTRCDQFGFSDPAEREIQILFRNAMPTGSGPSSQDRQDMESVSDWEVGVHLGYLGSDPRLGRASSPQAQERLKPPLPHERTPSMRWIRNCLPLPFRLQGPSRINQSCQLSLLGDAWERFGSRGNPGFLTLRAEPLLTHPQWFQQPTKAASLLPAIGAGHSPSISEGGIRPQP